MASCFFETICVHTDAGRRINDSVVKAGNKTQRSSISDDAELIK